jgi:hypothetical protein
MRTSSKVIKQARESEGNAGYAVKADFPKKHFWTLSVWLDAGSMRRFVMAEPHATAVKKFAIWAGEGAAFAEWQSPDCSLDWIEAMRRLESPSFYYTGSKKR